MKDRTALVLTAIVATVHLAVAGRYDLFRDELYFIVCGRHPAFGFVDQPPLVPFIAAAAYAVGGQTWIVRLPAVAAAAALVWLVIAYVRLLGGRDGAAWIAGLAVGFAPMFAGLTATLNTTTFEPLAWTAVAYGIARAVLRDDRRALLWSGVVAGLAMEAKYALPLWLLALAAGVALTPQRRLFARHELWIALGIAAVIALPSVLWQAAHGWPFAELVRNAGDKDIAVSPAAFALNQIFVLDPLFAPIWLCGLAAPFAARDVRPLRFVSIAFVLTAVAIVAGHGKDYYLAPAYPPLFAAGAVVLERLVRSVRVRAVYLTCATALAVVAMPLALPVLAPATLVAYERAMHLATAQQERGDEGDVLPSTFADMLGWHRFVDQVGSAYAALPQRDRAATAILVENYGEAAALDVYGAPYGLPPALAGHNQYYLWGSRGQQPVHLLRVQNHPERLRPYCTQMQVIATTAAPYARSFENGLTIAFCRNLHPSLTTIWPMLKEFI